jgi:hypothetical protein
MPPPVPGKPPVPGAPGAKPGAVPPPPPGAAKAGGPPGAPGAPGGKPGDPPQEDHLGEVQLNFWQQPWVQNVLPFVSSLTLHAAIFLIGWLLIVELPAMVKPALEEQVIIPEAVMADGVPGGVENPGLGGLADVPAAQDKYTENTDPLGWAPEPGESEIAEAMGGGAGDTESDGVFALGPGSAMGTGKGTGTGTGDGTGGGTGTGRGRLAPFGTPGGGIPGPRGKVFGAGGNARTIAFVCDSSGSMINTFGTLRSELQKAVDGLKPIQSFSILFFSNDKYQAFENGALVPATPDNKRKAFKWLADVTTTGTSNPVAGLELALKTKPQLMYVLTDGDFPNNDEIVTKINAMNTPKVTRINTIAFVQSRDDEVSQSFTDFLNTIAKSNGGVFRMVAEDEI